LIWVFLVWKESIFLIKQVLALFVYEGIPCQLRKLLFAYQRIYIKVL
jgi:hypothetical protein